MKSSSSNNNKAYHQIGYSLIIYIAWIALWIFRNGTKRNNGQCYEWLPSFLPDGGRLLIVIRSHVPTFPGTLHLTHSYRWTVYPMHLALSASICHNSTHNVSINEYLFFLLFLPLLTLALACSVHSAPHLH